MTQQHVRRSAGFVTMVASLVVSLVASSMVGCGDDDRSGRDDGTDAGAGDRDASAPMADGGETPMDGGETPDDGGTSDGGAEVDGGAEGDGGDTDGGTAATPSAQIAAARAADDGSVTLPIEGAWVTYLKPAVGDDPAGFFVQADVEGPALFVSIDPTATTPTVEVGDEVSFTITEMASLNDLRHASAIEDLSEVSTGNDVSSLVQDVSSSADLDDPNVYESELITVAGSAVDVFRAAGDAHLAADFRTEGVTATETLRLRVPTALRDDLELVRGCSVEVTAPLWRFRDTAQVSAWTSDDITLTECPAPTVTDAVSSGNSEVTVSFDRSIDDGTLVADGSQFTFTEGLTASAAVLSGPREVTVTTSAQDASTEYTVTVASSLEDTAGSGIDETANTATFMGFPMPLDVTRVDYPVVAHGGQLVLTGGGFSDATTVIVGGVEQAFTVDGDARITIGALDDATPLGAQDIVVSSDSADGNPFGVTVIRLVINEVDVDQTGSDSAEFIELTTGVGDVDLTGYVVVLFNGSTGGAYDAFELSGPADADGMFLLASAGVVPSPQIELPGSGTGDIQNGEDGIGLYQGTAEDFSSGTAATREGLLDAIVYDTNDGFANGLLTAFFEPDPPTEEEARRAYQPNEDAREMKDTDAIQRCGDGRVAPGVWTVAKPTPLAENACTDAQIFCLDYEPVCGFGGERRYADFDGCVSAYEGYAVERQMCVETHLGLAISDDPGTHCPHATGEAPCN